MGKETRSGSPEQQFDYFTNTCSIAQLFETRMTSVDVPPSNLEELRFVLMSRRLIDSSAHLSLMHGGVSSLVAIVKQGDDRWVARVPLERLDVEDEWIVDRSRGNNEAAILDFLEGRLGPVRVPRLRFMDVMSTILGEEFIEGDAPTYKDELLAGRTHPDVAAALGIAASELHRRTPPATLAGDGPRQLFDALRLDPYYRATAQRVPDLRANLAALIDDTIAAAPRTLVHGDLTPKNVLITSQEPVLLDWEVVNTGDPAFDLGTVTAHFILKALRDQPAEGVEPLLEAVRRFWISYNGPADRPRAFRHTGAVMLARLYGKSPVEYLADDHARSRADNVGRRALSGEITDIETLADIVRMVLVDSGRQ
jgi:aminoglycoside phosphotransferase (APT) family kinase protein